MGSSSLSDEKADLEKLIHEFGVRHNKELGELILKILKYRKNKAKGTPEETEAEEDYKNYSPEFEVSKHEKVTDLTEEELIEIKKKYRSASKLCHPAVQLNDKWGFINKEGELIIPFVYEKVYPFSNGVAAVEMERYVKSGYINKERVQYWED